MPDTTPPRAPRSPGPTAARYPWAVRSIRRAAIAGGVYGGIHFEQGDHDARATGRIAAQVAWEKARDY